MAWRLIPPAMDGTDRGISTKSSCRSTDQWGLLWVINGHRPADQRCPHRPQKPTFVSPLGKPYTEFALSRPQGRSFHDHKRMPVIGRLWAIALRENIRGCLGLLVEIVV